jgi:hypothetical protein
MAFYSLNSVISRSIRFQNFAFAGLSEDLNHRKASNDDGGDHEKHDRNVSTLGQACPWLCIPTSEATFATAFDWQGGGGNGHAFDFAWLELAQASAWGGLGSSLWSAGVEPTLVIDSMLLGIISQSTRISRGVFNFRGATGEKQWHRDQHGLGARSDH